MYYGKPSQRPQFFRLNANSPLARGLVFAGLGQHPGTAYYQDESPYKRHGIRSGPTTTEWEFDNFLQRRSLTFGTTSATDVVTISNLLSLAEGDLVSFSTWIYSLGRGGAYQNVIVCGDGTKQLFQVYLTATNGYVSFFSSTVSSVGSRAFSLNAWHHLFLLIGSSAGIVAIDGVASSIDTRIYAGTKYIIIGAFYTNTLNAKVADPILWRNADLTPYLSALADPGNVDLRIGGVPLILNQRRYWPVGPASGEAPAGNRRRRVIAMAA
jgi:hypothetical protein